MNTNTLILIVFSYLIGSISSAILISQYKNSPDPRSYGSKNPGATNILRKLGKKTATIVVIFDILKGIIPIWIGSVFLKINSLETEILALSTYIGHIYPIFFNFRGGKGVATAFGSLSIISIDIAGIMITTWISSILISGYVSLGTIITSFITPIYICCMHPQFTALSIILSLLILIRHYDNIMRLYQGQEIKIWHSKIKQ
ncbi:glycerol-3-phosphate 1-O-acyltransferase PlsY [Blochmannia endosymbiont of Polyrhachis (Hedomyrma) turneri]|uniref:glycerol-3-phosphate 1-O-acyltransferase PlsY n=1 Tax=Blochmannia endosymbiont of Polyrhachis (Hedomyrma) turneri TaxID=1505596 RepID=UPI00061A5EF6|nr:glycerol-3-phosphate 1-O-acyltransferase PlsY [Blochmannia endosymbiont of Polyrhachis (Hedomyrma) turneri]AKC59650.1 putative glycerol-3-phosphate acyltransferase [Blochmannia endosymbiont of Polyrhachis (Hedomyrma) turneri]